jgi:hypothetical protein
VWSWIVFEHLLLSGPDDSSLDPQSLLFIPIYHLSETFIVTYAICLFHYSWLGWEGCNPKCTKVEI